MAAPTMGAAIFTYLKFVTRINFIVNISKWISIELTPERDFVETYLYATYRLHGADNLPRRNIPAWHRLIEKEQVL